jgi:preprotein translocase subunit SecE
MSRALRRQPLVKKPPSQQPSFKPSGPRPQAKVSAAAQAEAKAKRSFLARIPKVGPYMLEIGSELRKVTWPTREETTRLGFAVIVVSVSIGLALGGIDIGFNWLVDNTLLR